MTRQDEHSPVRWRLHPQSPPAVVYARLPMDAGRASFWAETAIEENGIIHFVFPNGASWLGRILAQDPPHRFVVEYSGSSISDFQLTSDGTGGTDLTLVDSGVSTGDLTEVTTGWVSVLLALKASVDFHVDLRNHDPRRSWDQEYANN
jgi:hypothetical protein